MNDNGIISIGGKKINYGDMSGEEIITLYEQLKEREFKLYKKIKQMQAKYDFLPEVNIDEMMG